MLAILDYYGFKKHMPIQYPPTPTIRIAKMTRVKVNWQDDVLVDMPPVEELNFYLKKVDHDNMIAYYEYTD